MHRYYITDRHRCPSDLLDCIEANARRGVRWIQVREKDLAARDLLALARAAVDRVRPWGTSVLVNGRLDIALAAQAHGVHLPSDAPPASELRRIVPSGFLIAVSTHTRAEVVRAAQEGADLAVFGPVFPTLSKPGLREIPGLQGLRDACGGVRMPVAALGGVTEDRAQACQAAGAAAIAGIGMFQVPGIATSHQGSVRPPNGPEKAH